MEKIILCGQLFSFEDKNNIEGLWKTKLQSVDNIKNETLSSGLFVNYSAYDKKSLAEEYKNCHDYVSTADDFSVKATYNKCQILIYYTLFGTNNLAADEVKEKVIKHEWINILLNGTNSQDYNNAKNIQDYNGQQAALRRIADSLSAQELNELESIKKIPQISDLEYEKTSDGEYVREGNSYNRTYGLYHLPQLADQETQERKNFSSANDVINAGDSFINSGEDDKIDSVGVQELSSTIYNVLLIAGIIIAILIGAIIGIKFMLGSIEEKADIKQVLIPYIIGCIIIFGAFGIWKLAVTVFANM